MAKHKQKQSDIVWEYQWAYIKWNYYTRLRPKYRRAIQHIKQTIKQKITNK